MNDHAVDAIAAHGLSYTYPDGQAGVNVPRLVVPSPGLTGILGVNGAGKSTILELSHGDLRGYRGSLRVLGIEMSTMSDGELQAFRRRVALVPQKIYLPSGKTVHDVIRQTLDDAGVPEHELEPRIAKGLLSVGLTEVNEKSVDTLAGGQKRRVQIAQALARDVELLLLDEPLANVDQESQRSLIDLLKQLGGRVAVVVVTHENEDLVRTFSRSFTLSPVRATATGILSSGRKSSPSLSTLFIVALIAAVVAVGFWLAVLDPILRPTAASVTMPPATTAPTTEAVVTAPPASSTPATAPSVTPPPATAAPPQVLSDIDVPQGAEIVVPAGYLCAGDAIVNGQVLYDNSAATGMYVVTTAPVQYQNDFGPVTCIANTPANEEQIRDQVGQGGKAVDRSVVP